MQQLSLHLEYQPTTLHLPETWVAITLLKLITPASLQCVGYFFGVGKVTTREMNHPGYLRHPPGCSGSCCVLWVIDLLEVVVGFRALSFP